MLWLDRRDGTAIQYNTRYGSQYGQVTDSNCKALDGSRSKEFVRARFCECLRLRVSASVCARVRVRVRVCACVCV